MLTVLKNGHDNVLAVKASGEVSAADCREFLGHVEAAVRDHPHPDVFFELENVHGPGPDAPWDDPTFCLRFKNDLRRVAIVGNKKDRERMKGLPEAFVHARLFPRSGRQAAWAWLAADPAAEQEAIRRRAYARWEEAGRPTDHALEFWLAAERDVLQA